MVLRIETSRHQELTIFALSGNLDEDYISELEGLFGPSSGYSALIVDLSDIRLAGHAAVRFLTRCERHGIRLHNCPEYIREWIAREDGRAKKPSMDMERD
jgi:hypothetical protein